MDSGKDDFFLSNELINNKLSVNFGAFFRKMLLNWFDGEINYN